MSDTEASRQAKHVEITKAIDDLREATLGMQEILARVRNEPTMEGNPRSVSKEPEKSLGEVLASAPKEIAEVSAKLRTLRSELVTILF